MNIADEVLADLHRYLYRRRIALGHDANAGYVADGDAFEGDWRSVLEPGGVVKISPKSQFVRKDASRGGGHKQDEQHHNGQGRQDQCAHSQLRPLNLFAAWQVIPLDGFGRLSLAQRLENSRKGKA